MKSRPQRTLGTQVPLLIVVVALGLGSRVYREQLPEFIALYAGDTLWATAVVVALGLVRRRASTASLATAACAISLAVECSQLAHPPWLEWLRRQPGVALLIGYDFVWSDLACYAAGVLIGATVDLAISGPRR